MPVPHFNIKITQRSKGNSAVAGAAYQAGEKLFSEYDQKTKNYTCKKKWSIRKSCCPQMLHPNMQTEQPSGTPLKKSKSNGTHSLQDGLLPPCPEKSRWSCYRRWSKNTARNSLFQRECVVISQSMTPIRRDTIPIAISC